MSNEMNAIIAIFDGWKLFKGDPNIKCPSCDEGKVPSGWCICDQKTDRFQKEGKMVSSTYFQYHTSWDWLMSVVEKVETPQLDYACQNVLRAAADVQILYKACIITYEPDEESGDTNDETTIQTSRETKLEAVYHAVYQFITWYNSQLK